jgi:hypothetical protein
MGQHGPMLYRSLPARGQAGTASGSTSAGGSGSLRSMAKKATTQVLAYYNGAKWPIQIVLPN